MAGPLCDAVKGAITRVLELLLALNFVEPYRIIFTLLCFQCLSVRLSVFIMPWYFNLLHLPVNMVNFVIFTMQRNSMVFEVQLCLD